VCVFNMNDGHDRKRCKRMLQITAVFDRDDRKRVESIAANHGCSCAIRLNCCRILMCVDI